MLAQNAREAGIILEVQLKQSVISSVSLTPQSIIMRSPTCSVAIATKNHTGILRARASYESPSKSDSPRAQDTERDSLNTAPELVYFAILSMAIYVAASHIAGISHVRFRRLISSYVDEHF